MEDREGELELALVTVGFIAVCAVLSNFKLRKKVKQTQRNLDALRRIRRTNQDRTMETQRCLDQANMRVAMKMREPCTTTQEIEAVIRDENEFLDIVQNYAKRK